MLLLAPTTLYVAESGTGDGSRERPAAIGRLRELLNTTATRPLTVQLSGTLRLDAPLELGPEAGGVTLKGPAVISGGVPVTGWQKATFLDDDVWAADLPFSLPEGSQLRQLFVGRNGERWERPGLPGRAPSGFFAFAAWPSPEAQKAVWNTPQRDAILPENVLTEGRYRSEEWEYVVHHYWVTSRLRAKAFDPATRLVEFDRPSIWKLGDDAWAPEAPPARFRVENVAEGLWQGGTFYWDRPSNKLYAGERPSDVVAPRLPTLLTVRGAEGFALENVTFSHTEVEPAPDSAGDFQGGHSLPAAVTLADCVAPRVRGCGFEHLGVWGLEVGKGTRGATVERSRFEDLGAGAVKLASGSQGSLVTDNVVRGAGRIHAGACGIWGGLTGGNRIVHNEVSDLYYTGISLGWDWGFKDTEAKDNLIAFNDIANVGQGQLSDMGGIYVLGKQPNSFIRNNRIRDVDARGYGGWGIYLDEGSTGWTVEDNVVTDTKTGGFHIHYGGDNLVQNNVFAGARTDAQLIRSRDDGQGPIRFERNVVVSPDPAAPIVGSNWLRRDVVLSGNLYWTPAGKGDLPFGDDGTGRWLDPKLNGEGLPTNREVFRRGFRRIELKEVGPRR